MGRLLLITDAYPPEIRSSSTLMRELAEGLRDRGHEVFVLTTYPSYNLTPQARQEFRNPARNLFRDEGNIKVIRVPTPPLHNVGRIVKGLSQLTLPILLSATGVWLRHLDAIIVYSPPLPLGLVAAALKKATGARFILNVQDLFPRNAVDLGILRNPALIAAWEYMEDICYRAADAVTCHSQGNIEWLRRHHALQGTPEKVQLVYNWVNCDEYEQARPDETMRQELGLYDRFVFIFGGVMGFAQDLETIVCAAAKLVDHSDIVFLLVGDGVEREKLQDLAKGLRNVVFHPFIEPNRYIRWLKTADAGLVTLRASMKTPVVPSKILGFMAAERPYLAVLPRESDAWIITKEAGCGLIVEPGVPESVATAVVELASNRVKAREMGKKGYIYCRRHFSKQACIDRYESILRSMGVI